MRLSRTLKIMYGMAKLELLGYVSRVQTYNEVCDRYPRVDPTNIIALESILWDETAENLNPEPKQERVLH